MTAFRNSEGKEYSPGELIQFDGVTYSLGGKTRNLPVSQTYLKQLMQAVQATDPSLRVKIVSGGQPAKGSGGKRTGSTRHDVGPDGYSNTADLILVRNGKEVRPGDDKALYSRFLQNAAATGFTGIGHYGWGVHIGGGKPAAWGPSTGSRDLDPEFAKAINAGRKSYASGVRLPYVDIPATAPTPLTAGQAIADKRQAYRAANPDTDLEDALMKWAGIEASPRSAPAPLTKSPLIQQKQREAAAAVRPATLGSPTPAPAAQTAVPTWDAFYDDVMGVPNVNKASSGRQDRARPVVAPNYMSPATPQQVASLYEGVYPKPKVAATLPPPGSGLSSEQRNAMLAMPKASPTAGNLVVREASNRPDQTWGVGGANQAGTTQLPRDVRPSSLPPAPKLSPLLADLETPRPTQVPVKTAPKLSAPGAGLSAEQRFAMSKLPDDPVLAELNGSAPKRSPLAAGAQGAAAADLKALETAKRFAAGPAPAPAPKVAPVPLPKPQFQPMQQPKLGVVKPEQASTPKGGGLMGLISERLADAPIMRIADALMNGGKGKSIFAPGSGASRLAEMLMASGGATPFTNSGVPGQWGSGANTGPGSPGWTPGTITHDWNTTGVSPSGNDLSFATRSQQTSSRWNTDY